MWKHLKIQWNHKWKEELIGEKSVAQAQQSQCHRLLWDHENKSEATYMNESWSYVQNAEVTDGANLKLVRFTCCRMMTSKISCLSNMFIFIRSSQWHLFYSTLRSTGNSIWVNHYGWCYPDGRPLWESTLTLNPWSNPIDPNQSIPLFNVWGTLSTSK